MLLGLLLEKKEKEYYTHSAYPGYAHSNTKRDVLPSLRWKRHVQRTDGPEPGHANKVIEEIIPLQPGWTARPGLML